MKKVGLIKLLVGLTLAASGAFAVGSVVSNKKAEETQAAVSKTVTRVYIEDQVNSNTTLLAIESISFASGYGHTQWRDFLNSYLGSRSSYTTTSGSTQPSTKGWSYMSDSEQEKYLLCPSGSKNFTMTFPDWVTAFSYKAVGNNFWNWFDVGGSAVGVHSGWGIGKKVNSYIYDDGGWKMNAGVDNTAQTNTWGDVTITAIAACDSAEIERKSITMSKYYLLSSVSYGDIWGYTSAGEWYTNIGCTSSHSSLVTANATAYSKKTMNKVAYIKGTMNNWSANDNYLMTVHENHQYRGYVTFAANDEFKVNYTGSGDDWYGWSQVDGSSTVVTNGSIIQGSDPDSTGYRIKVKTAGTYEIYLKVDESSNKLWIQQDSASEAAAYATTFLSSITCTDNSVTSSLSTWNNVSGTASMEYKFNHLTQGAQNLLSSAEAKENGTVVEQCAARYDRILGKYGYGTGNNEYHDFMGRTPAPLSGGAKLVLPTVGSENSNTIAIIVIISLVSVTAIGGFFFIRKRREN